MDDVLTELPPPSRFFEEDLDNFATPPPSLPPPVLRLNPNPPTLRPSILIIAISAPSLALLRRIAHKTRIGSLILPETNISSKSCNIYSIDRQPSPAIIAALNHKVSYERSRAVAKALLDEIRGERVLILDSIKVESYRSRLLTDEAVGFKLETSSERLGDDRLIRDWEYLPSGSVMAGLGAAMLVECQMRGWKATMCATWPEDEWSAAVMKLRDVMRDLGFDLDGDESGDDDEIKVSSRFCSELYV
ncbi:uncharacterized protein LOC110116508 [Dendrobium catenatum]|uniref:Fatty acid desaturase (Delta-4 desaturase) n=1 Tax=Dendrobium catenatum TaxID=906689 RepID=A0A2I0WAK2_9ASPA|nr:uncharacterized protein LOC110116508 [Dendrobium catenatum]XP_020705751.1 uncharacterized protein LOC110116508 [Dendrobium catenatum]PKU72683.1 fatty acid desaturase (delta-4 desaturase) [Dendrobium catenatum]